MKFQLRNNQKVDGSNKLVVVTPFNLIEQCLYDNRERMDTPASCESRTSLLWRLILCLSDSQRRRITRATLYVEKDRVEFSLL